jgi:hypothetical protein
MPSMPRKTLPSKSGVKFAAYKDEKDRLKKARAIAREKARLRELRHIALFMADDINRYAPTVPTTPDPEKPEDEEHEFWMWNWSIFKEHEEHFYLIVDSIYGNE